jgi:Cof subfamily protein (haloacid dehalogenase superfamily)
MAIKLIALDIDGTIIEHNGGALLPNVREAVDAARASGVRVMIATGRWYNHMTEYLTALGSNPKEWHASVNGAVVVNSAGQTIWQTALDGASFTSFLEKLIALKLPYVVGTSHDAYRDVNALKVNEFDWCATDTEMKLNPQLTNFPQPIKVMTRAASLEQLAHLVKLVEQFNFSYAADPNYNSIEIWPAGVHKGTAIKYVADSYGIAMSEVMGVGDSDNDIGMFTDVGLSVAVGNGTEKAKATAMELAPAFDEGGAVWAINKFVLKS